LENLTVGGYLRQLGLSDEFRDNYLLPMGAAIWSTTDGGIAEASAESFIGFFANHNLLQMAQPRWRTVSGGSRAYVDRIAAQLGPRIRTGAGAAQIRRDPGGVAVTDARGRIERFDQVILACHSDQALRLLVDADAEERAFLGAVRYGPNRAYLHRDPRLMPRRRAAWGSWNALCGQGGGATLTYWMNSLQKIDPERPLFVSLNPETPPDPALTFEVFDCEHPQFDTTALAAQRQIGRIQGRGGVWYAGAWLGHGFHEDGLTAGLRAGLALGGTVPWAFVDHRIPGGPLQAPRAIAPRRRAAA
jgi:predicted NAD/FAD-binding protein